MSTVSRSKTTSNKPTVSQLTRQKALNGTSTCYEKRKPFWVTFDSHLFELWCFMNTISTLFRTQLTKTINFVARQFWSNILSTPTCAQAWMITNGLLMENALEVCPLGDVANIVQVYGECSFRCFCIENRLTIVLNGCKGPLKWKHFGSIHFRPFVF